MIFLCKSYECNVEQVCKENDMESINISVPLNMDTDSGYKVFIENFNRHKFLDAVKALREGNVFIGCESGNLRTKRFLSAVNILDPKSNLDIGSSPVTDDYIFANWIYKELCPEEKLKLGYTKEFEHNLLNKLKLYAHRCCF